MTTPSSARGGIPPFDPSMLPPGIPVPPGDPPPPTPPDPPASVGPSPRGPKKIELPIFTRCGHDFGTHRWEILGPDGQKLAAGQCLHCKGMFPAQRVEVQDFTNYALYVLSEALIPQIVEKVADRVVDKLVGRMLLNDL